MKEKLSKYASKEYTFTKKEKLFICFSIMIISGFFGFIYEYLFYYFNSGFKEFYWRGANFIPWIDIYALGALIIYKLTFKYRRSPTKVFFIAGISCGLLEYLAGLLIFILRNGYRSWNYNNEILNFGNIQGFVCLRSVLIFAISGLILIYLVLPFIFKLIKSKNFNTIFIITTIIISIILIDEVYNLIFARIFDIPSAGSIYSKHGINYHNANI